MPRPTPANRLKELLDCAIGVFLEEGYRRAQMADVAEAMGVAKGTVYLYVESKEALFEAAMFHAAGEAQEPTQQELPLAARPTEALAEALREVLDREAVPPSLDRALARKRAPNPRAELEGIVRELYRISHDNRTVIQLIDRCAKDRPDLAETFYRHGRMVRLLTQRIEAGQLRPVPDASVAARFIIETIATWAVHRHWDPAPQPIDSAIAEETVVHFVLAGLIEE